MRIDVPLPKCYLLLNHGPVTLVTTAAGARTNVMAASWAMPLDFDPPKVVVVIDRSTLTRELVDASGEFALNVPPQALADRTLAAGSVSGRRVDKWATLGLEAMPASLIRAPLVAGCLAWLECRVLEERLTERKYDLFIAAVVAASADDGAYSGGRWRFGSDAGRTVHYAAGGQFFTTGAPYQARAPLGGS